MEHLKFVSSHQIILVEPFLLKIMLSLHVQPIYVWKMQCHVDEIQIMHQVGSIVYMHVPT